MWGHPANNWDSSFSESHHKTRIKAPSKNTQNCMDKLIEQTATRLSELHLIHTATNYYGLSHTNSDQIKKQHRVGGTQFQIFKDDNGSPSMSYTRKYNHSKPLIPDLVLQFCCNEVFPLLLPTPNPGIDACTEHKRYDPIADKTYLFCCN